LRPLGRIVHYGAASMTTESRSLISAFKTWWKCLTINSMEIISDNKSVSGYHLGYLFLNETALRKTLKDIDILLGLYKEGKIKMQIDSVFPYSKIGEAMKRMHTRQNIGKIILKPDCEIQETITSENQVQISTTATTTTTPLAEESKQAPEPPKSERPEEIKGTFQEETKKSTDEPAPSKIAPTIDEQTPISA
jgi:hypothetical protein